MGKPVEIEFLMRDKLTKGVMASGKTVITLGNNVDATTRKIKQMGHSAELETGKMDRAFKRVLGGVAFGAFIRETVRVRGEIQQLGIAFETMLGSKKEADAMMSEIIEFAQKTPFTLTDVADNVKQLIAMGIASEDVMDTLKSLGDVAAGVSVPISRIAINYGQVATLGKLQSRELRDFAMAGVPLLEELAKILGVTKAEVQDLISEGRVGFPLVEQAFKNMSVEGGRFANLMEKQNASVTGQISKLKDEIEIMLNKIGEANEGVIYGAIKGASTLVENYEKIGRVLLPLIATVGAYKAALIGVSVAQKAMAFADNIRLIGLFRKELGLLTAAQQAFNASALKNPYVLLASVIIGAAVAIGQFVAAEKAKQKAIDEALKPLRDEFTQTNLLVEKLKKANLEESERKRILEELRQVNPAIVKNIEDEADAVEILTERLEAYNKAKLAEIAVKKFSLTEGFEEAVKDLQKAQEKMQERSADMIDVYSTLFTRFRELEAKNANIPENLRSLFTSIIESSMPETRKVETLFKGYNAIIAKVNAAHGTYSGADWHFAQMLFRDLDIDKYEKGLKKLNKETEEYEEKAQNLKGKINSIANAIYDNEGQRQEFIFSQWAVYFPKEVQKVGDAIDGAGEKTKTWKDEIVELVDGDYKADIEAATNIPEVIDAIQKAIKTEKERIENMKPLLVKAGFDFSAMQFPEGYAPSLLEQKWAADFTKAQNNLTGLNNAGSRLGVTAKTKEADAVTKKLQTQIDLTRSAKEEYAKLLKVMSSDEAFKTLKSTAGYANVRLEDIVSTKGENEGYIQYLEAQIKALSTRKTQEAKALVAKLQKELDGLRLENIYNAAVRAAEIAKLDKDYTKTLSGQTRQAQLDLRQAEIDAMNEGFAREQEQLALNYDRLIAENEQRQQEWIESARNRALAEWRLENPDKDESQFTRTFSLEDLTDQQQQILRQYTESANAFRASAEKRLLDNMLEQYADYAAQRQKVEANYNRDIAALESKRTAENSAMIDRAIDEARKQRDSAFAEIDVKMMDAASHYVQLFEDASQKSVAEIEKILIAAAAVIEYVKNTKSEDIQAGFGLSAAQLRELKNDPEKLKAYLDAVKKLKGELGQKSPFKQFQLDIKDAFEYFKKGGKENVGKGLVAMGQAINKVLPSIQEMSSDLAGIFGESQLSEDINDIIGAIGGLGDAAGGVGKIMSGDISGIKDVIKGVKGVFDSLFNNREEEKKMRESLRELDESRLSAQRQYNQLLFEQIMLMKESVSIFGTKDISRAIGLTEAAAEQVARSREKLKDIGSIEAVNGGHWDWNFWGTKADWVDDYESILKIYPDLITAEGELNIERAKAIVSSRKMSDADRDRLQEMIDISENAQEAMAELRDYLQSTFGELGEGLMNSLVSAIQTGIDAWDDFADAGSRVLENLGKQIAYEIFFADKFKNLQTQLEDIYSSGKSPEEIARESQKAVADFYQGVGDDMESAQQWMEEWQRQAQESGFSLWDNQEQQSGKAGAFQTMSQDTGTKLEGLFTANQMRLANIEVLLGDVQYNLYIIGDKLAEIADNTKGCDQSLKKVVILMEKIDRDGLKVA